MGIGRDDNLSVDEMGLPTEIVEILKRKNVEGWDALTSLTFQELTDFGLSPEQITVTSDAVREHLQ